MLYTVLFESLLWLRGHEDGGTKALRSFIKNYQSTLCKIPEVRQKWKKNRTCPRHEGVRRSRGVNPLILNFYIRWKWDVNLRPRPKNPQYVLNKSLGGPHVQYGRFEKKNKFQKTKIKVGKFFGKSSGSVTFVLLPLRGYCKHN
jgi:hypothetical protein